MKITPVDQKSEAHRRRLMIAGAAGLGDPGDVSETVSLTAIGAGMAGGSPGYGDSGTPDGFTTKPDNPQSIE